MDETFSSVDFVAQCLLDTERTEAFKKAIEQTVKPGDIVLDSGTGSGILAMFAAKAGAKKVIALELDPYIAKLARDNVVRNGLQDVVEVVNEDIRNYPFDQTAKFDVVIMEMLTTGMIDEYQVWAVNQLHGKGAIGPHTIFIPFRQDTTAVLVNADFTMFGLDVRMPLHLWKFMDKGIAEFIPVSNRLEINSIGFNTTNPEVFSREYSFTIANDTTINALYIESTTQLAEALFVGDTMALNGPVLIPFNEEKSVAAGEVVQVKINYFFGNGYRNFSATFI
ncbi:MAG: 50S ribosomal protein L11 methyltransferase [Minisyncoccia bacterium]